VLYDRLREPDKAVFRLLIGLNAVTSAACGTAGLNAPAVIPASPGVHSVTRGELSELERPARLAASEGPLTGEHLQGLIWRFRAGSPLSGAKKVRKRGIK